MTVLGGQAGKVTLLFTDVEGSTRGWEAFQDAYDAAIQRHFALLTDAVQRHGGIVFKTVGDQVCAAFPTPSGAVRAAVDGQRALHAEPWPDPVGRIRVRMALHSGTPVARDGDFLGPPVNRVARLLSAAHPGQILASASAASGLPTGISARPLGVHLLKDLLTPETLFQLEADGLESGFPPPRALDARAHNLPVQLTSFVGREMEMELLSARMAEPATRLVTLTGPPGVGKTRLALQYAAEQTTRYPDGVWLVELARLREPDAVAHQILTELGIPPEDPRPAAERLASVLARRKLLLVCDNFEHLLPAAAMLADVLSSAPGVQALVTSRAVLRVRGESVLDVAPLAAPSTGTNLHNSPATMLFLERAAAARPDWRPGFEEADEVAALCRELDGLPLAIELAAARLRSMTLREIRHRLSDRFRLLSAGASDRPERQRTLRAALDWSFGLLNEGEQQLLAELSVFRGGFTLDSADAVCDPDATGDAWESIEALQNQSFLVARELAGVMRYDMLVAVREYARERLGEGHTARQAAHAAYFLRLAEEASKALDTERDADAIATLDREAENVRAALDWSLGEGDAETLARLACATAEYFHRRGRWQEREQRLSGALEKAAAEGYDGPDTAWLHYHHANALADLNRLEEAAAAARESFARACLHGDARLQAWCTNLFGFLAERQGNTDEAERHYTETIERAESAGDDFSLASALTNLGRLADLSGDADRAEELYARSLPLWRRVGSARGLAATLTNLGCLADEVRGREADQAGQPGEAHRRREEAIGLFREALALQIGLMNRPKAALLLNNIGEAMARDGRPAEALPLFSAAENLFRQAGSDKADYVADQHARAREQAGAAGEPSEMPDPWEVALTEAGAIPPRASPT